MFIVNKYQTHPPYPQRKKKSGIFFKLGLQLECKYVRSKSEIPQLIPEQLITFCANWWSELNSDSVVEEPTLLTVGLGIVLERIFCIKHVCTRGLRISSFSIIVAGRNETSNARAWFSVAKIATFSTCISMQALGAVVMFNGRVFAYRMYAIEASCEHSRSKI